MGGKYKGKTIGLDIGCFSFEDKKSMTTGDGGIISPMTKISSNH
ncbi:DegT/DnrJ/EryC1/StrS family aminotransferase [Ammoniphilus sp. 3BR4]